MEIGGAEVTVAVVDSGPIKHSGKDPSLGRRDTRTIGALEWGDVVPFLRKVITLTSRGGTERGLHPRP